MARAAAAFLAACVGVAWSGASLAQTTITITRTSSFAYDAASGLLTQEAVEPNISALRLETDYGYDGYGNKTSVTVVGADITTRSTTSTYDPTGAFVASSTNALSQSETWQYDARFGKPTSHTGPNGLTTTWTYDGVGRKILEVRADGTRTKWAYLFCNGVSGGAATCVAGAAYLVQTTPLAADGATQNGPVGIIYFDSLDREIARDTQGFDARTVRASRQYDSLARLQQQSRPYFASGGTPQWTVFAYDGLSRVVKATMPDGSVTQHAFHGLVTTATNALGQTRTTTKNSQGHVVAVTDALGKTMSYAYDPFGNLIQTTDAVGNIVTATYDQRGRKIASSDPDLGAWTYSYNTLSQLTAQTDAKGQVTSVTYDLLGRATQKVEADMTSAWTYDTAAHGVGKPASESITAGPDAGYQKSFSYDALSRPAQVATTIAGAVYTMAGAYDSNGRLSQVTYPSGLAVGYSYTSLGYPQQLVNSTSGQAYWTANALDAEQHLTQQTAGNGISTIQSFDPATGRLTAVVVGTGNAVENLTFTYDLLGNLLGRADGNENVSESFVYDPLNRVTASTTSISPRPLLKTFAYDPIGNMLTKSDVGDYGYPAPGAPLPHAVTSISGSTFSTTFAYDPNGNQVSGLGRNITWTSFNMPASITQGTRTISFSHDPEHQHFRQVSPEGTTLYFDAFGIHAELFSSGNNQWNEYLSVGNVLVGVRFLHADESVQTRYFHVDHLGSIAAISDENGAVVERLSYDTWGKRRFANGTDDPAGAITSRTTRGFTGQEQLADVGLVHLNGRLYDPLVGRMISADPTVTEPLNGQSWNRYSYVGNDPLTFTDPNGFSWLSNFFHSVADAFTGFFHAAGSLFRSIPILGNILELAATVAICGPLVGVCSAVVATVASTRASEFPSRRTMGLSEGRFRPATHAGICRLRNCWNRPLWRGCGDPRR